MKKPIIFLMSFLLVAVIAVTAINDTVRQISSNETWIAESTGESHRVMLVDVTEDGDACIISVDGYSKLIYVGDDMTINGVYIKVFDAYPTHSQLKDNDACKVFVGSSKGSFVVRKEIPKPACKNEGDITANVSSCCSNLTAITFNSTSYACTQCGNGECVVPENSENCPADCKVVKNETPVIEQQPSEPQKPLTVWQMLWNFLKDLFR